jgi:hypothetical protein
MQFYGQVNDNDKMNNNNVNNINSNNHRIDNNITITGNNEVDEVDEEYKRYRLSRGIDIAKAVPSYINSGARLYVKTSQQMKLMDLYSMNQDIHQ